MSKRRWTYEQHAAAHAYFRNLQQEKTKRIAELEAQLEQHRWIPVTERLPENVATVFILTGEGAGGIGFYGKDKTGYIWERLDHAINLNITHWKLIIEP